MIRQGDVLLIPATLPQQATLASIEGLRIVGERTGHAHELACEIYQLGDRRFAKLSQEAILTHQEHRHIPVPAGVYEIRIQREYVPLQRSVGGRFD